MLQHLNYWQFMHLYLGWLSIELVGGPSMLKKQHDLGPWCAEEISRRWFCANSKNPMQRCAKIALHTNVAFSVPHGDLQIMLVFCKEQICQICETSVLRYNF